MIAVVWSIFSVSGSNMAIVAAGPKPGNTPTMVPRITPTKHQNKLTGVSATEKPSKRLLRASIGQSSRVSLKSPESRGQRNIEGGDENQLERNGETDTDADG